MSVYQRGRKYKMRITSISFIFLFFGEIVYDCEVSATKNEIPRVGMEAICANLEELSLQAIYNFANWIIYTFTNIMRLLWFFFLAKISAITYKIETKAVRLLSCFMPSVLFVGIHFKFNDMMLILRKKLLSIAKKSVDQKKRKTIKVTLRTLFRVCVYITYICI